MGKRKRNPAYGVFWGHIATWWLDSSYEDRRMQIHAESDLRFERSAEMIQPKPGFEFDGASIPPIFWILFGSPFTGKYRLAAVIHDWLCHLKDRTYQEAHWVMYEAMRALGVGEVRARLIYWALMAFGTKW